MSLDPPWSFDFIVRISMTCFKRNLHRKKLTTIRLMLTTLHARTWNWINCTSRRHFSFRGFIPMSIGFQHLV